MTWTQWIAFHASLFSMQSDADAQTLGVWIDLFIKEGFTPEQMKEASEWVALNTEIKYRSDLLPRLLSKGRIS